MKAPPPPGVALRSASPDDRAAIGALAGLASAAHDEFVFGDPAGAAAFYAALLEAGVCEFGPRWSTLAVDADGQAIGICAVLAAGDLRRVRMQSAMWFAKSQLAQREPELARRLQLAASTGLRPLPTDAYLSRIAVQPGDTSRGVGAALLEQAVATAISSGADRLALDVASDNTRARGFYERAGFAEIGRARVDDATSGRALEYVHMARVIQPTSAS